MRGSSANSVSRVARPFFWGRNPSKQNFSFGNPDATNAGTKAVAPGRHSTVTPLRRHSLTKRNPGSEMAGVPASEIRAMFSPPSILVTIPSMMLVEFMVGLHASVYIEVFQ